MVEIKILVIQVKMFKPIEKMVLLLKLEVLLFILEETHPQKLETLTQMHYKMQTTSLNSHFNSYFRSLKSLFSHS